MTENEMKGLTALEVLDWTFLGSLGDAHLPHLHLPQAEFTTGPQLTSVSGLAAQPSL